MNVETATATQTTSASALVSVFAIAALGLGVIFLAGHVQAGTLHDAAHDVRHATGFPCH
ncbi:MULTISPECIES: CbtB domain-containing protein [unclassified Roseovarius]|uniref:CbtB domain-containing protein n=1 Tax=unclassified Roseovarius TaxID=2614913 RepID=UPI00273E0E11|nr:CbtB domain-containing protein [Roseovarius sp. MMSF_3350]